MAFRIFKFVFGPSLKRIHRENDQGMDYLPNKLEKYSTYTLYAVKCLWYICKLSSPVWIFALYRRWVSQPSGKDAALLPLVKPFAFVMFIAGIAYFIRGVGRYFNPVYRSFLRALTEFERHKSLEGAKHIMQAYDCDFDYLPVDYTNTFKLKRSIDPPVIENEPNMLMRVIWKVLAYGLLKTIGRRMLYPGSLQLFNAAIASALTEGRAKIMEKANIRAHRAKIKSNDGNFIDSMFVDNRASLAGSPFGNTLVICCEGNAGYYELGIMGTPMSLGYSVLGWNHPGFGCSTGEPMPNQEFNAIDAVMRYATEHLKFPEKNILLFAWSIGGFSASWAAASYPEIAGVILDATFDDLLPLAYSRFPKKLQTLVKYVVRHYLNLNIAELLCRYNGPIMLIRRRKDEILTMMDEERNLLVNRADYLLTKLLSYRYPNVVNDDTKAILFDWMHRTAYQREVLNDESLRKITDEHANKILEDHLAACSLLKAEDIRFPLDIGKNLDQALREHLTIFLAKLHMKDIDETHCTPLAAEFFIRPWHPIRSPNH